MLNLKLVQEFFKPINIKEFSDKYNRYWTYTYLIMYITGKAKQTKQMDMKIQDMMLAYHDDNFEIIEKITHKIKE